MCGRSVKVYKMPEANDSTTSHLSVVMMSTGNEQFERTLEGTVSSTSSHIVEICFQSAGLLTGVIGMAANGLILYAMVASQQHKKHMLVFNQNVFDLCSSLLHFITYTLRFCDISFTDSLGYWLCMLILSEGLLWCSLLGSVINLMSVTVERYLKVVHPNLSKKLLRKWVIYGAVAFPWISSATYIAIVTYFSSGVVDGICYGFALWESMVGAKISGVFTFLSFFVVPVFIFLFCYGRILVVIRRQAKVMAAHAGPGPSTAQSQSTQIQTMNSHELHWCHSNNASIYVVVRKLLIRKMLPFSISSILETVVNIIVARNGTRARNPVELNQVQTNLIPTTYCAKRGL